jgi:hypothetical protein
MAGTQPTRFPTRSGRTQNDDARYTHVVHGITGYRVQCTGCHLASGVGPFRLQQDADAAARAHADRCRA